MKGQPDRLPASTTRFSGTSIDRQRPLRFRLDGRLISGFAGDTVLSAVLASGIDTLGRHGAAPIALTPASAPAIAHATLAADPQRALPMSRTVAQDGAEFVTLGSRQGGGLLARILGSGRSLGLPLDRPHVLDQPWRAVPGARGTRTDLVVIGAGVAGLSAALAGARRGLSVTLLEATPHSGDRSGLFGTQDGEDSPEDSMARLGHAVATTDAITLVTAAQAYALRAGLVRIHRVEIADGLAQGRVEDIETRFVVIATGSLERLPIFAGNRLPGTCGTMEAYELAARYGVWRGGSAVVFTTGNTAYRLARLARDAGIDIPRILDSRAQPSSRFIEFSRAYGIVQAPATGIVSAMPAKARKIAIQTDREGSEPLVADRLLLSAGWQPDLTLWHAAGGQSAWHKAHHRLEPSGALDGIVLAGSAAGYMTRRGCIQSGADAVDALLGRSRSKIEDPVIDPFYETPDAQTPIAVEHPDNAAAYLDGGAEFLQRPLRAQAKRRFFSRHRETTGLTALSEAPQPLAVCDVAAGVDLGLIPPASAGIVAQERVALVPLAALEHDHPVTEDPIAPGSVPAYLAGRFGPGAKVVKLLLQEPRRLESGTLIFSGSDVTNPLQAQGVVLRSVDGISYALVADRAVKFALPVTVRDQNRAIAARLEPFEG